MSAVGGGPTHVRHLLRSPLSAAYDLIHFEVGSRGRESPSSEESLWVRAVRLATSPFHLAWAVLRNSPAVVHVNVSLNYKAFWRDALYVAVGKMLGRKIVYQIHGGSVDQFCGRPLMRSICRVMFRLTDSVVVISTVQLERFASLFQARRVMLIANAVDLREFDGAVLPDRSARTADGLRVLYLARLVREKGIFELIDAMSALRHDPALTGVTLTIAGSGPAYQDVVQRVTALGLDGQVQVVGPVQGESKARLLREADVFILPSYHEGLPYSVLESLACGIPVVATRVGGIPDLIDNGVHGLLIEPRSAQAIVQAVTKLACDRALLKQMSGACLLRARERYGLDRLSREFDALYRTLIESA
ncbi:MAG: glycosyltransferase family 4 protein [Betaproteobacteria bacterium]